MRAAQGRDLRVGDVVAAEDLGKRPEELRARHRAHDRDIEQAVVEPRAGRDAHAARVRGTVADRDQPSSRLEGVAVDGHAEPVRLVDGERAQDGRDIEGGAGQSPNGVGPPVRLRVEARRGDARVPAPVHAPEIDDPVVAVRYHVECAEWMLGVVAEHPGEVVAGAGRHDREPAARVGGDARDFGHQSVAAAPDEIVTLVGRGASELGRRTRFGGDVQCDPRRFRGALELGKEFLCPTPTGYRIDDRGPRHGRKLLRRRGYRPPVRAPVRADEGGR